MFTHRHSLRFLQLFLLGLVFVACFFVTSPVKAASGIATGNHKAIVGICLPEYRLPDKTFTNHKNASNECEYTYVEYVTSLYKFAVKLGSILASLMIIYAAFLYTISKGDTTKLDQAKEIFIGTLLGLALLYFTGVILKYFGLPDYSL